MSEEREEVYQILELGKHLKNLHHKKGFGGLLFIDLSMIKFSKLSSYIRQLDKENQELKKQLEKKNKPQMFIDTQDIEERYAEELYQDFLKEENKQLKKKLEEKENIACDWKDSCLENAGKIEILETQQKEFIKWLEDYLNLFDYRDIQEQAGYDMLEEILQKYREVIGVSDEKK